MLLLKPSAVSKIPGSAKAEKGTESVLVARLHPYPQQRNQSAGFLAHMVMGTECFTSLTLAHN